MPKPKGSAGHNKIVSDQEAGNVVDLTVETGARSEDSEGSLFSIWSGYLSAAEKSDDDADLLTEIINDSIKETHPGAEQDTSQAAPVIPSMSGRALDAFLEEDSADRKPFGLPEGEFLGEAPDGSPKDAADSAAVGINNSIHWESAITFTHKNSGVWNTLVKNNYALS